MTTPDFVLGLRRHVGHAPLPLVGVTAIVVDGVGRVLMGTRSDNGAVQPVSGIVEPGEEPADTAVREVLEEAGVVVRVTRLALVHRMPRVMYANGDIVDYLVLTFRCEWVSGHPSPADGELTDVAWMDADAALHVVDTDHRRRMVAALGREPAAIFLDGR